MFNEIDKKSFVICKAFLIVMVICSHCLTSFGRLVELDTFKNNASHFLYTVEVPVFFILSWMQIRKQDIKAFYKKKIFRVLIV